MINDIKTDIAGNELSFNGNTFLKPISAKLSYTKEHIQEYMKCVNDIFYFAETYYKILSIKDGMVTPKLRDYQYDMINNYKDKRFNIVLATRQCVHPDTMIDIKINEQEEILSILDLYKKFDENNKYEILTDDGFLSFSSIRKTHKSKSVEIQTTSFSLITNEDHSLFDENMNEILSKNVKIKTLIQTTNGIEEVIKISEKEECEKFDIVDVENSRYFSNGILSHNCGKTTSIEIYVCWLILFHKDQRIAILANKEEQAKDILRKIKDAYEYIPMFIQQGVKVWNVKNIILENGSSVLASSTSSNALRGKSCSLLVLDELAFVPTTIFSDFLSAVYPTISSSPTSKVVYISTFNGLNHFFKLWDDAKKGLNEFNPYEVKYHQVPLEGSSTGFRDEVWKQETIANIGIQKFRSEYNNEALGSIATLIEPDVITELKSRTEIQSNNLYPKISSRLHQYIKIYEEPIKGHTYVAGVDSAKMTVENAGDALGIQILDITSFPIKQVATIFIKEGMSYLQAPELIFKIGTYYNSAMLFVENNEIGQEVANMLHFDLEYENVYFEKGSLPGFRTTKKTKRLGCTNLKLLIENNKLILNDFDTISQLSTFIKKKLSYCAENDYQDDLIMAMIASLYFLLAQGLEFDIIESTSDLGKQIIENINNDQDDFEEEISPMVLSDEYENKIEGDFDWL